VGGTQTVPAGNAPLANSVPPGPAPTSGGQGTVRQGTVPAATSPPSPTPAPPVGTAVAAPEELHKPVASPPTGTEPSQATATVAPPQPVTPPISSSTVNVAPQESPKPTPTVAAPPQPPAPPPQPAEQQLAVANPGILRNRIAQWVNGRTCAVLGGDIDDRGSVVLSGIAGGDADNLRQDFAALVNPDQVDWLVSRVDHVFCPALNALRPLVPAFGATQASRLGLQMAGGKMRLHDGEPIGVSLVMPDFASRLVVDYIAHDGSVQHLYPQLAQPENGIRADPPRTYGANEQVKLGNPAWLVGPPYGTDMIIAVASSAPLFDHPRPSNAEAAEMYIHELQAAIDRGRQHGVRLAGAAVTLEALPKQ
jgi:hypothetical protein